MSLQLHSHFIRSAVAGFALSCIGTAALAQPAPAANVSFPALDDSYLKTGDFIGPDHVKRIKPGLSKDQVRLELGNPHFNEGIFGVSEWDYAFNFYTGDGGAYVICQFKVKFDQSANDYRVASTHWKTPGCERYLNPVVSVAAPVAAPMPPAAPQPPRRYTLGADGLFTFGKSGLADLLPAGRSGIEALAAQIRGNGVQPLLVVVTGHTDRIGSDASNTALSQARANTVRDYLVQQGFDARQIRAFGAGKSQPVAQCTGNRVTPELIACLQPNRRVDIEVTSSSNAPG